jgi:hypothetical protein
LLLGSILTSGLLAGGLVGAGVARHWYGPGAGVGLAALLGLAVGLAVRKVRRRAR